MDDAILQHTNVHNWRVGVRDRTNLIWYSNLCSILMVTLSCFRWEHQVLDYPRFCTFNLSMCKAECCGSSDSSLGGEKIIFAMLYTHVMCLQMMYVIAHVCLADRGLGHDAM